MLKHTPLILAILLLAGCGSTQNIRQTDQQVAKSTSDAERAIQAMHDAKPITESSATVMSHKQYVDTTPIMNDRTLPKACNDFTFKPSAPMSLLEATAQFSRDCGIQVRVTPDALDAISGRRTNNQDSGNGQNSQPGQPGQFGPQGIPVPAGSYLPSNIASNTSNPGFAVDGGFKINGVFEGAQWLDLLTTRFGLSWRNDHGTIVVFSTTTRIFRIYSLPQAMDTESTITSGNTTANGVTSGAGGGGGASATNGGVSGSSGSTQSTTLSLKTNPADDLVKGVKAICPNGSVYFSASSGSLIVTDTPEHLDRVKVFVDDLNTNYAKQILDTITFLSVTVNKTDNYDLNWSAVYKNLASNFGVTLSNSYTAVTGGVSGAVNILTGNQHWSGSSALINALAQQGNVRVLTETSVVARNMKPTPVQVARQTGYLASSPGNVSGGTSGTVVSQGNLTPGSVTTGFNMNLTPYIFPDNKNLEVQLTINLSDLVSLLTESSGGSSIQVPTLDNKMFSPDVQLRSDQTAVIASFKQNSDDNERSGTGSAWNWLFGGGITGTKTATYIVIIMEPHVLPSAPNDETFSGIGSE